MQAWRSAAAKRTARLGIHGLAGLEAADDYDLVVPGPDSDGEGASPWRSTVKGLS